MGWLCVSRWTDTERNETRNGGKREPRTGGTCCLLGRLSRPGLRVPVLSVDLHCIVFVPTYILGYDVALTTRKRG